MNLDNARNAQIEILRNVFDYSEFDTPYEGPSRYIDPDYENLVAGRLSDPAHRLSSSDNPFMPSGLDLTRPPHFARSHFVSKPTSQISIGISSTPGSNALRLSAVYQRQSEDVKDLLAKLQDRFKDEIDFFFSGPIRSLSAWHNSRQDTPRPGSSIGHSHGTGTLGCYVRERTTNKLGILSANHVIAKPNNPKPGDPVLHPGPLDGGDPQKDVIATLTRFIPILPAPLPTAADCAYATLTSQTSLHRRDLVDSADIHVSNISTTQPVALEVLDKVIKVGRTTGYTQGQIHALNLVNHFVEMPGRRYARFDNVIRIHSLTTNPFAHIGDSGSLILNNEGSPGGLLFSVAPATRRGQISMSFANPLDFVLNTLHLEIVI